jgi:hypothetical protein
VTRTLDDRGCATLLRQPVALSIVLFSQNCTISVRTPQVADQAEMWGSLNGFEGPSAHLISKHGSGNNAFDLAVTLLPSTTNP